ncbi:TPA: hypothetical protein G9F26_003960 [Salmonella enterica]|uniref:Uncharacterized protein n=1 Tax=Salmonella enterica TaxID=28901 RepID=A0A750HZ39_SALER|nr:hypothetical protein [Salmonella enterica]
MFDVFRIQQQHYVQNNVNEGFSCFIQTPDNLKGNEPADYPYFDFDAARKQQAETSAIQPRLTESQSPLSSLTFYLVILLGAVTFIAFIIGFTTGFLYGD